MNNIYLIGMPGCGKTTVGKKLSALMDMKFIDADDFLENMYSQKIPEIFKNQGEKSFRKMETQALQNISHLSDTIVSTGGGVVTCGENKNIMKKSGKILFIDCLPEFILEKSSLDYRPLLKDKEKIFDLYKKRIDSYNSFADIIFKNDNSIEELINSIACYLEGDI